LYRVVKECGRGRGTGGVEKGEKGGGVSVGVAPGLLLLLFEVATYYFSIPSPRLCSWIDIPVVILRCLPPCYHHTNTHSENFAYI